MSDPYRIESETELREVIPQPHDAIKGKLFEGIDEYARAFIEKAPIAFVATSDAAGHLDVSPKGDAPGFIEVEDAKTLLLPERIGNRLTFGFQNLLERPHIGLILVIPGVTETLRVNGAAELTRDPALLERLSAGGKPAILATRIRVEECFFHCGKAFIRSALWKPDSWPEGVKANIGKQIAKASGAGKELAEQIDKGLEADYETGLY
jgi:PPOX class probable FMN-dependent enzyme